MLDISTESDNDVGPFGIDFEPNGPGIEHPQPPSAFPRNEHAAAMPVPAIQFPIRPPHRAHELIGRA
jgi:hypothetical protein